MSKITAVRHLAEVGYAGCMVLMLLWQGWLSPHPHVNPVWVTVFWMLPLLLPLRGIWQQKPYTHAWSSFIACLYLCHGLVQLYDSEQERWLALAEIILVSCWLVGSILYARWQGQILGLGLKKKK